MGEIILLWSLTRNACSQAILFCDVLDINDVAGKPREEQELAERENSSEDAKNIEMSLYLSFSIAIPR